MKWIQRWAPRCRPNSFSRLTLRQQIRCFGWSDRLENFGNKQKQEEAKWKDKWGYSEEKFQEVLDRFDNVRTSRKKRGQVAYQTYLAEYTDLAALKYWIMWTGLIGGGCVCGELMSPGVSLLAAPFFIGSVFFTWGSHVTSGSIPLAMGATKLSDDHEITLMTKKLVANSNVNPDPVAVYLLNTSTPNAFASGFTLKSAAVTVTQGLVDILNKDELEAVLAHEVGHVVNGDMRLNLELVCMISGLYACYRFSSRSMYRNYNYSSSAKKKKDAEQARMVMMFGSIAMMSIGKVLQLYISREREYAADASGVALTGNIHLATALMKIDNYARSDVRMKPSPLEKDGNDQMYGHMYLYPAPSQMMAYRTNAKGEKSIPWLTKILSTHPPTKDRIKAIREDYEHLQTLITAEREPQGYHVLGSDPEEKFKRRNI